MNATSQDSNRIITISTSLEQQGQPVLIKQRSVVLPRDNAEVARMKQRNRVQRRMKLFVLVRILLQYLERVDPATSNLAKEILKDCERKHDTKDSKYATLADAIHDRLRDAVGEAHWTSARQIQKRLAVNKQHRRVSI